MNVVHNKLIPAGDFDFGSIFKTLSSQTCFEDLTEEEFNRSDTKSPRRRKNR